jgi:hypothetical protein
MAKAIYIVGNQGLGDQLVLNGLYRYFAKEYEFCVIGIANRYQNVLKSMLRDVRNVYVSGYRMEFWESNIYAHRGILERVGYTTLSLGEFATLSYAKETESLDENLYRQASIPHSVRWNNFYYMRDRHKEKSLYDSLGCGSGPYIFLHEDLSRGYKIREELIPSEFNIVRPNPKLKGFSLFDYLAVMENAQEIHCIESSFAILAEQMRLEKPKYAHRYARHDVANNRELWYSYQSPWNIIN